MEEEDTQDEALSQTVNPDQVQALLSQLQQTQTKQPSQLATLTETGETPVSDRP